MNRTRIYSAVMAMLCLAALAVPAAAAEIQCDAVYCFTVSDFSEEENLAGICITELPEPAVGTVKLGERVLQSGDVLTAQQVQQMTFHPLKREQDRQAQLTYLPIYENRVDAAAVMSIAVIGKRDQAPVAEDSAMETYRNLPNEAMLKVKDPEGEKMTYTVTRFPKRGEVVLREDGSFIYTPGKNKVGVDSFSYTATDPAGNVSREATVTITVVKPSDAAQYSDTAGKSCRFAAEWMKNTGIFVGESINGNGCFQPEKQVSRGEFLTMLVQVLEIPVDGGAEFTGYTDDVPGWLKPYLAAALRSGLTSELPSAQTGVFGAGETVTGGEAAVKLQSAMDLAVSTCTMDGLAEESEYAWAETAIAVMAENGIHLEVQDLLTRGQVAVLLYQVSRMAKDAPGLQMYH